MAGKRAITADTDLRLCRFFGLSNGYWLRAQVLHDTEVAERMLSSELAKIIDSLVAWQRLAGLKNPDHWVTGRSAFELAHSWLDSGAVAMPEGSRTLLDSRPEPRGITADVIYPERRIAFDQRRGEPRNADLAFVGQAGSTRVVVTIEAKADEKFAQTVAEAAAEALERAITNERSAGVERIRDLVRALVPAHSKGLPHVGSLRYQLLTALAGTIAFAIENDARYGVLVVHEFVTDKTLPVKQARNAQDFSSFMQRLFGVNAVGSASQLCGPFTVQGSPLFATVPAVFVGKVTTVPDWAPNRLIPNVRRPKPARLTNCTWFAI